MVVPDLCTSGPFMRLPGGDDLPGGLAPCDKHSLGLS